MARAFPNSQPPEVQKVCRPFYVGLSDGLLNPPFPLADDDSVTNYSFEVWLALGAVSGAGILAMLFCLAAEVRNHTHVHDLKVKVHSLRMEYQIQVQQRKEAASRGDVALVPVVEEIDEAPVRKAA